MIPALSPPPAGLQPCVCNVICLIYDLFICLPLLFMFNVKDKLQREETFRFVSCVQARRNNSLSMSERRARERER